MSERKPFGDAGAVEADEDPSDRLVRDVAGPSSSASSSAAAAAARTTATGYASSSSNPAPFRMIAQTFSREPEPFQFMWIYMLGHKFPAVEVAGEPSIPLKAILNHLTKKKAIDIRAFGEKMKQRSIYIAMATQEQAAAISNQGMEYARMMMTDKDMIRRSDIERMLGELRIESTAAEGEHDHWDQSQRLAIVHHNFVEYDPDLWSSDDLDENVFQAGVIGHLYYGRRGMRCIICVECLYRFTPDDFIVHHHFADRHEEMSHYGLNSSNWAKLIQPYNGPEATEEEKMILKRFLEELPASNANKRKLDSSAEDLTNRALFEETVKLLPKKKLEKDEEVIRIIDRQKGVEIADLKGAKNGKRPRGHNKSSKAAPADVQSVLQSPIYTVLFKQAEQNPSFRKLFDNNERKQMSDNLLFKSGLKANASNIKFPVPSTSSMNWPNLLPFVMPSPIVLDPKWQKGLEKAKVELESFQMKLKELNDLQKMIASSSSTSSSVASDGASKMGDVNSAWELVVKEQQLLKGLSEESVRILDSASTITSPKAMLPTAASLMMPPPILPPLKGLPLPMWPLSKGMGFPPFDTATLFNSMLKNMKPNVEMPVKPVPLLPISAGNPLLASFDVLMKKPPPPVSQFVPSTNFSLFVPPASTK